MAYTDIDDPSAYFQTTLYVGNNGTQTVTHGGNSDIQADWIWGKARNDTASHFIIDSVRGVSKRFKSNAADAEATVNAGITAIGSDSFAVGNDGDFNDNNINYVTWNWKEIAGVFDIVSYTGNATSGATISHNLGVAPTMMLIKCRSNAGTNWIVYHATIGNTHWMYLNATNAASSNSAAWNNTSPTASQFSLGNDGDVNGNGRTYIAYLFGNKQGVSKVGSYTGNGNANGTFVYTGFKPAWLMIKRSSTGGDDWMMTDNKMNLFNVINKRLNPNSNGAEQSTDIIDFVSNGFKLRATPDYMNGSGDTYTYMAFAENPFVTSTGVPATAR